MRRNRLTDRDQLPLQFDSQADLERVIEMRVTDRCEAESFRWRFRLVAIETIVLAALVAGAGLTLEQPTSLVVRAALLIGGSCFATGVLLIGLSALGSRLWVRLHRRRSA